MATSRQLEVSTELQEQSVTVSGSQTFPKEVTKVLEDLYLRGMRGWGQEHTDQIEIAITTTKLTVDQVKVLARVEVGILMASLAGCKPTKFHSLGVSLTHTEVVSLLNLLKTRNMFET